MRPLDALVAVAASARLARLIVDDTAGEPIRVAAVRVGETLGGERGADLAGELVGCRWCASVWTSAAVVALAPAARRSRVVYGLAATLAVSQAAGIVARLEE